MKKNGTLAIIILVIMLLCLSACNSQTSTTSIETNNSDETDAPKSFEEEVVTNKDITITVRESGKIIKIDGYYTGNVKNGKPEGEGKFDYWDNSDTYSYEYEGEFSNGTFNGYGIKTLKDSKQNTTCVYEGEFKNGNYNGYGKETKKDDKAIRVYEGEFRNGNYNGYGVMNINNTKEDYTYDIVGDFTNGKYTPTPAQAFDYIGNLGDLYYYGTFRLLDEQAEYIYSHNELFPTCEKATAEKTNLVNFNYKKFTKTGKQEEIGLVKLKLTAIQVFEDDVPDLDGTLTNLLAVDAEDNNYAIYYRDSVEVYDYDDFTVYAIPCSTSYFDNISGGTTNVVVLLACYME